MSREPRKTLSDFCASEHFVDCNDSFAFGKVVPRNRPLNIDKSREGRQQPNIATPNKLENTAHFVCKFSSTLTVKRHPTFLAKLTLQTEIVGEINSENHSLCN